MVSKQDVLSMIVKMNRGNVQMILKADYDSAVIFVKYRGKDAYLKMLQDMYPSYGFYKFSTEWITNKSYACKVKGTEGDLSIRWK